MSNSLPCKGTRRRMPPPPKGCPCPSMGLQNSSCQSKLNYFLRRDFHFCRCVTKHAPLKSVHPCHSTVYTQYNLTTLQLHALHQKLLKNILRCMYIVQLYINGILCNFRIIQLDVPINRNIFGFKLEWHTYIIHRYINILYTILHRYILHT